MAKTAKNSFEETHERILQGALEEFSDKGYSATIKEISLRVGCNTVTIFRHFQDKQSLFFQVVERYHRLEFDDEALQSKLSYTNVHADLATMAKTFFEVLFKHIHILRIYINDGANFERIAKYAWYLPAPFKHFFMDYLETIYPGKIPPADAALLAEMFVSYITRTCLRENVHDGVEAHSRKLARETQKTLSLSVDMILQLIMMHVRDAVD